MKINVKHLKLPNIITTVPLFLMVNISVLGICSVLWGRLLRRIQIWVFVSANDCTAVVESEAKAESTFDVYILHFEICSCQEALYHLQ